MPIFTGMTSLVVLSDVLIGVVEQLLIGVELVFQ
jgi:hypothetical protein